MLLKSAEMAMKNICYQPHFNIHTHIRAQCVITVWRLGEVETQQVVRFRTVLSVTHHQLASFSAAKTEVLVRVFTLRPQLPLLRLQLGVPGLLLFLHYHSALEEAL